MSRVADPLREYCDCMEPLGEPCGRLREIADQIDKDHRRRVWQVENEVRRTICKDIRWAVTQFESAYKGRWAVKQKLEEDSE